MSKQSRPYSRRRAKAIRARTEAKVMAKRAERKVAAASRAAANRDERKARGDVVGVGRSAYFPAAQRAAWAPHGGLPRALASVAYEDGDRR